MIDLDTLNTEQRMAVECLDGPLLVLAGAGSGKTRVLTYRIANLIEHGVRPWNILALTFTNKAAREMRERTESLVGASALDTWVMTFHAACARILRHDIEKLNLGYASDFTIYDDSDQMNVLESVFKSMNITEKQLPKRVVKSNISAAKNGLVDFEEFFGISGINDERQLNVAMRYQQALLEANAMDFDDILLIAIRLFSECPPVLNYYKNRFKYVLVDEYQDTNRPQYMLIKLLCEEHKNICVVGDDDQSIYGWRGADVRNILEFEHDFLGAKVIRLEQNYRSTGNILEAANSVIANNLERKSKKLWTSRGEGEYISVVQQQNERREAEYVCREILREVASGKNLNSFAVVYRMNAQSRVLENTLLSYGIAHRIYGGHRFYDRKEVKDVLAYLRLLANKADDVAFRRIINLPARGIGQATLDNLAIFAENEGVSLYAAAKSETLADTKIKVKLRPFVELMERYTRLRSDTEIDMLTRQLLSDIGYKAYLEKEDPVSFNERWQNVEELIGNMMEVADSVTGETDGLAAFLENVALMSDIDAMAEDGNGAVSLMTLHSAKGLEFDTVFIVGMEEGIFPSSRSTFEPSELEEERRLMYVGITRAKRKLHLVMTRERTLFGRASSNSPSRFIDEIPKKLCDAEQTGYFGVSYGKENFGGNDSHGSCSAKSSIYQPKQSKPSYATDKAQAAASCAKKPSAASGASVNFSEGPRVRHERFGNGTVTGFSGTGGAMIVMITFDTGDVKRFAAAYAPITII